MRNMKNILFVVLAVVLIAGTFAFADTYRLGANKVTFSETNSVATSGTYTVLTTDSAINVTASSANVVIKLPKISSFSGFSKSYLIRKKDATSYKIVVTPASGDTIGGESTRYLVGDEDYMVIQSGSANNWTVAYESPYLVENHAAGTYQTGIGSAGLYVAPTVSATLTNSSCGNVYAVSTDALTFTLPAGLANCQITFINNSNATSVGMKIATDGTAKISGRVFSGSILTYSTPTFNLTQINNVKSTSSAGDYIRLYSTGTNSWIITGSTGTWHQNATP